MHGRFEVAPHACMHSGTKYTRDHLAKTTIMSQPAPACTYSVHAYLKF